MEKSDKYIVQNFSCLTQKKESLTDEMSCGWVNDGYSLKTALWTRKPIGVNINMYGDPEKPIYCPPAVNNCIP